MAAKITPALCTDAISAEWALKARTVMWPGMSPRERREVASSGEDARTVMRRAAIWVAARELLNLDDPAAVSGRLVLGTQKTDEGDVRVVRVNKVRSIASQFGDTSTLLLDATLPDPALLRPFYPDVEVIADVQAAATHARIRQVLGAPTSANKLKRAVNAAEKVQEIRRAIILRFVELGRAPMLVVAQKSVEERLVALGLPDGITVGHFNAVAGLDRFRDVRSVILVGRTLPSAVEVESTAAIILGQGVRTTKERPDGVRWYEREWQGLRLADGAGYAVEVDRHPDPVAEAVRWQVCEGELLQALGRARAVNRTTKNPVDIEIWSDVLLPVTVDQVEQWTDVPCGPEAEMLADGIMLKSHQDVSAAWPQTWPTPESAKQWAKRRLTACHSSIENLLYRGTTLCEFRYRRGAGRKWRTGGADLRVVPNPRAWLESRLEQIRDYELVHDAIRESASTDIFEAA